MDYKNYGSTIVVRLDKGDEIAKCLLEVAEKEKCRFAYLTGIGAVDDFEVGVFDLEKADYNRARYTGNHEINALVGNLTTKDGKPYLHAHITCTGKDGAVQVIGGEVDRKYDPSVGINKITF